MAKKDLTILDADGNELHACLWEPAVDPLAVVAVIHGLGDHIERYANFSTFLNKHQICVLGMDLQGHGKSPGKRGHIRSYDLLLSNVEKILIAARLEYIDIPLFLFGHSLGGNIVANYLLRHQSKEVSGGIITSSFFRLAFKPPGWKIRLARFLDKIWPSLTLDNEVDPMELSHNPDVGMKYLEDTLVHGKTSLRLYNESIKYAEWALANAGLLNYPLLVMHGDEDRITEWQGSEKFTETAGVKATFKLWRGLRHELHNENSGDEVLNYICTWIKRNI